MRVKVRIDDEDTNLDIYELLIKVGSDYSIEPSMSAQSEEFFEQLLTEYPEDENDMVGLEGWLQTEISKHFRVIRQYPRWIQSADWPFDNQGRPMIFAGQIDIEDKGNYSAQVQDCQM